MSTVEDISKALREKAGYMTVKVEEAPNKLTLYGRQPPPSLVGNFKLLRGYMWLAANGSKARRPWKVDISAVYFVDEAHGQTQKYAWRFIFSGKDIAQYYADVCTVVHASPVAGGASLDTIEIPLMGGANRNSTAGGKRGAGEIGKVVVGPMAVMQKMNGG